VSRYGNSDSGVWVPIILSRLLTWSLVLDGGLPSWLSGWVRTRGRALWVLVSLRFAYLAVLRVLGWLALLARSDTPVATPVSIVFDGDRAFFRSYQKAWKTKRSRNDPRIEFSPATLRGKPTGPPVHARAVLLQSEQARIAASPLARRHRVLQGMLVASSMRRRRPGPAHHPGCLPVAGYLARHDIGGVALRQPSSGAATVTIVNEEHLALCSSPEWARFVEDELLPWVLDGHDLGDALLEVGPVPGLTTDVLRRQAARQAAAELDPGLASQLAARLADSNAAVVLADAACLPFAAGSFYRTLTVANPAPPLMPADSMPGCA
jgi:PPOX class probable F420-dependent enzyme